MHSNVSGKGNRSQGGGGGEAVKKSPGRSSLGFVGLSFRATAEAAGPLGGRLGCLAMIVVSIVASVLLTLVLNLLLR